MHEHWISETWATVRYASRDDVNMFAGEYHGSQNPREPQTVGHRCIVTLQSIIDNSGILFNVRHQKTTKMRRKWSEMNKPTTSLRVQNEVDARLTPTRNTDTNMARCFMSNSPALFGWWTGRHERHHQQKHQSSDSQHRLENQWDES